MEAISALKENAGFIKKEIKMCKLHCKKKDTNAKITR
jgi:hypothetical protein